ncbi:MAG: alpha/beta hydrolase [Chitinophagaceae bacterium]|nr:MAG: alpha/beta hydrolase [Chitinophagaceae bacterium]
MPYITNNKQGKEVKIFYQDHGTGQPVVLIHGWPLSHSSWEMQMPAIVNAGFRCISYDRRGFGKSDMPWESYDYDTLAADLDALITQLDLHNVVLIGFSMGGGEVVRYLSNYGKDRIAKAGLIASIIPLVAQKPDNPDGVPAEELDKIMKALREDRVGFLTDFHKNFYGVGLISKPVSQGRLDSDFIVASQAGGNPTIKAAEAWGGTDFRPELKNVTVPTLIVHGDEDRIVPIKTSGEQASKAIADNEYHVIEGAPHGLNVTHTEELNNILVAFLKK